MSVVALKLLKHTSIAISRLWLLLNLLKRKPTAIRSFLPIHSDSRAPLSEKSTFRAASSSIETWQRLELTQVWSQQAVIVGTYRDLSVGETG